MPESAAESSTLAFAERLFVLMDEGRLTSTYKYAVLLGLMDSCLEHGTAHGGAPAMVTTEQLARKVTALYWTQAAPYSAAAHSVLRQNRGGQAEIVRLVDRCRAELAQGPLTSYGRARLLEPDRLRALEREVEWKLVEMPLPRLQLVGNTEVPLLYRLGWGASIRRGEFNDRASFDNRILLLPNVGEHLVRLVPLVRPLVKQRWTAMVAKLNGLPEAELEEHLFGRSRVSLAPVAGPLRELQGDRCFYCHERLTARSAVDHFVPWARHPDDGLDNLVVAHERCNGDKRDFLAEAGHVLAWTERNERHASSLEAIAAEASWERTPEETTTTARLIYLRLAEDVRLWRLGAEFVGVDRPALGRAFGRAA